MADKIGWYIAGTGAQDGPYTFDQLETLVHAGIVSKYTLVWRDGLEDWVRMDNRPELATLFPEEPEPAELSSREIEYLQDKNDEMLVEEDESKEIIEVPPPETKTCPMCAETIKYAAVKCRYCGHLFTPAKMDTALTPVTQTPMYDDDRALVKATHVADVRVLPRKTGNLRRCPDCRELCSPSAVSCPTCGRIIRTKSYWTKNVGCIGVVYALLIMLGLATLPGGLVLVIPFGVLLWLNLKSWNEVGFR